MRKLSLVFFLSARLAPAGEGDVALHCGRLLDVRAETLREDVTVVVRGEKIQSVGKGLDTAGARTLDLQRATCLPGLMDLHAHILYRPAADALYDYAARSSAHKALDGLRAAQAMLHAGFTTLRDPGDEDRYYATVEIRDAIARGEFEGPRLLVAPHYLTATGGHGDLNMLAPDTASLADGRIVNGVEAMREAVRDEIKYGADWIKVFASGGVMSSRDDPRVQAYSDEELRAAVEETHRYRKKITVHAIGTEAIKASVRAGVDSVEHAILIDAEGISLMKQRGTWLVPTLYVIEYIIAEGEHLGLPSESIAKAKALREERDRAIRAAFAAGVKVAFGSDTIFPHAHAGREFAQMVRLGMSPVKAIRAATLSSAELLGLDSEIGSIEAGKQADIVAVFSNPLEDVRALENVSFVMRGGRVVRNDAPTP